MKIRITGTACVVEREAGDPVYPENVYGERQLLHAMMKDLYVHHAMEFVVRRMGKDGHLTADTQSYLVNDRCKPSAIWAIYHERYQIELSTERFNEGRALFNAVYSEKKKGSRRSRKKIA